MSDWNPYYDRQAARPASPLLTQALTFVEPSLPDLPERMALDLGCGNGHESRLLLEQGWQVHALDKEPAAIARTQALAATLTGGGRLSTEVAAFESLQQLPAAQLVHAGLSLPFCEPAAFPQFWGVVMAALQPGGLFAGHFFGPRDAWSDAPHLSFHSREALHDLLAGCDILSFEEFEGMAPSLRGPKYWHRFNVIARKAGEPALR